MLLLVKRNFSNFSIDKNFDMILIGGMKYIKYIIIPFLLVGIVLGAYFALSSEYALVVQYKGLIAHREFDVFLLMLLMMCTATVPAIIFLFIVSWIYRADNHKANYDPNHKSSTFTQVLLWVIFSIIVAAMSTTNWFASHELDPHVPIKGEGDPVKIQVIALNWKWLFIYPELGIATVNFMQIPEKTPINMELTADNAPINSFWIPQLSGQIYAMGGMITPLHLLAYETGEFPGRTAEINGNGYADMTFVAKASAQADFERWVENVKKSELKLDNDTYDDLAAFSTNYPVTLYSEVEKNLFKNVVIKYHQPTKK
jgi:cytochrome o ubiquinol oxidase subunit 2